jgi:hypothetical protein
MCLEVRTSLLLYDEPASSKMPLLPILAKGVCLRELSYYTLCFICPSSLSLSSKFDKNIASLVVLS